MSGRWPWWLALAGCLAVVLGLALLRKGDVERAESALVEAQSQHGSAPSVRAGDELEADPVRIELTDESPDALARGDPAALNSLSLHGRVVDTAGVALPGAWVRLRIGEENLELETDAAGAFRFQPRPSGFWVVSAGIHRHREWREEIDTRTAATDIEREIVLPPYQGVVVAVVNMDGTPLREAIAEEFDPGLIETSFIATHHDPIRIGISRRVLQGEINDNFGRFEGGRFAPGAPVTSGALGTVWLGQDSPAWITLLLNRIVIASRPVEPSTNAIVFTLTDEEMLGGCSSIRGRLLAGVSGLPVEGSVYLQAEGGSPSHTRSGVDGHFRLPCANKGDLRLVVEAEGFAKTIRALRLHPGVETDLGTIFLREPVSISGWVPRGDIENEGKIGIELIRANDEFDFFGTFVTAPIDGEFYADGLEPGAWILVGKNYKASDQTAWIAHGPGTSPILVDCSRGSVENVELELVSRSLLKLLIPKPSEPPWQIAVVRTPGGLQVAKGRLHRTETHYSLPPGPYTLEIYEPEGEVPVLVRPFTIDGNGATIEL